MVTDKYFDTNHIKFRDSRIICCRFRLAWHKSNKYVMATSCPPIISQEDITRTMSLFIWYVQLGRQEWPNIDKPGNKPQTVLLESPCIFDLMIPIMSTARDQIACSPEWGKSGNNSAARFVISVWNAGVILSTWFTSESTWDMSLKKMLSLVLNGRFGYCAWSIIWIKTRTREASIEYFCARMGTFFKAVHIRKWASLEASQHLVI